MPTLQQIMSIPIPVWRDFCDSKGIEWESLRDSVYSDASIKYCGINNDSLVSCGERGVMFDDYYRSYVVRRLKEGTSEYEYGMSVTHVDVYLRESVLSDLCIVDEYLRKYGLRLFIRSGYRSHKLQNFVRGMATAQNGIQFTNKMLADPERHAPHSTGAAFDLEIWSDSTRKFLPTKVENGFNTDALEGRSDLNQSELDIRNNRRLLFNILCTNLVLSDDRCFVSNPNEYWHFGRHEKLSSAIALAWGRSHPCYYDEIPIDPFGE